MIKTADLVKSFEGHTILKGVNLDIEPGEIYGLIGKNGAGKTTLFKIIAGLLDYDSGDVTIKSKDNKVGYLPDLPAFYDDLTAREYLDYLLMSKNSARRDELLELVDLKSNVRIGKMSRGMRQRLGIASALVSNPDIILLDEPTSALDPGGRSDVHGILTKLKKSGKTVVLSTHILNDMEKICDRVGFLADGVIKKSIKLNEVSTGSESIHVRFSEPVGKEVLDKHELVYKIISENEYVFLTKEGTDLQKKVFAMLASVNISVSMIQSEKNDLERLFMEVCA